MKAELLILSTFAHAGEDHSTEAEGWIHLFEQDLLYFIPLILLVLVVLVFVIYLIIKKSLAAGLITIMALLLIAGMALYSLAPIVSIICLVGGFSLSLFLTINGLRQQ